MTYMLVEKVDTTGHGCIENCVYEDKENPGSRLCFQTGEQPVTCMIEHEGCKCGIKKDSYETENEYPWLVFVTSLYGGVCGGSLIASDWVLTAATCLENHLFTDNASEVRILLGYQWLSSTHLAEQSKNIGVTQIIKHPHYKKTIQFDNDVALLRLAHPADLFTFTPACLPDFGQDFTGRAAWRVVWGANADAPIPGSHEFIYTISGKLEEKEMEIVNNNECSRLAWDNENQTMTNGMMCANSSLTTSAGTRVHCSGPRGGPLTVDVGGQHTLIGLGSFSPRNCEKVGTVGYYANVAFFRNWIDASISNFGTTTFCSVY